MLAAMTTARHRAQYALLLCTLLPLGPVLAASATAQASAMVVEAVPVRAWLGVPVSVQDLLLTQNAPAGPATGALVPRVPSALPPAVLRALPAWFAGAIEARQAFGMDIGSSAGAALLPRGPAAAVSVAAATPLGDNGDGDAPLVIIVAFN